MQDPSTITQDRQYDVAWNRPARFNRTYLQAISAWREDL